MAHLGHPLVGDRLYLGEGEAYLELIARGWSSGLEERLLLRRHALHCAALRVDGRWWRAAPAADLDGWLATAEIIRG